MELTVPIEDRVIISQDLKIKRYDKLIRECASNGWKADILTIEMGCRGYASGNFIHTLTRLGLSRPMARLTLKTCSDISLRCSYIIYLNRAQLSWSKRPYFSIQI